MYVYADHAATTRIRPAALRAMTEAMSELWGNPSSLHTPGQDAKVALEDARRRVRACLHASEEDLILFTSGGSEADVQAIRSAAYAGAARGRRRILTSPIEHHAVLRTLEALEREGFSVDYLPVGREGVIRPSDVERSLTPDTALVTVMYANNEVGSIQPAAEIAALCSEAGVLFHTDAVQAVGHIPVDVTADGMDYLALSAHKFGGPRGAGVLYVRAGAPVLPLIPGGGQEQGLRAGTEDLPAVMGLAAALEEAVAALPSAARTACLRDRVEARLCRIPGAVVNRPRDPEKRLPGILSVCFPGVESEAVILRADLRGVALSAGAACSMGEAEPSHVLRAMGVPDALSLGALRISLDEENTEEEADYVSGVLEEIVTALRRETSAT